MMMLLGPSSGGEPRAWGDPQGREPCERIVIHDTEPEAPPLGFPGKQERLRREKAKGSQRWGGFRAPCWGAGETVLLVAQIPGC